MVEEEAKSEENAVEEKNEENAVEEKNDENGGEEKKEEILMMDSTNDGSSRPGRTATTERRSGRRSGGPVFSPSPPPTATRNRGRLDNANSAPSQGGTRKRRREELDAGDPTKQLQSRMASPPIHSRTSRRGSYTPSETQIVIPEIESPSKRQKTNNHNHNHNHNHNLIQQQSVSACLFILEEFFTKCK